MKRFRDLKSGDLFFTLERHGPFLDISIGAIKFIKAISQSAVKIQLELVDETDIRFNEIFRRKTIKPYEFKNCDEAYYLCVSDLNEYIIDRYFDKRFYFTTSIKILEIYSIHSITFGL